MRASRMTARTIGEMSLSVPLPRSQEPCDLDPAKAEPVRNAISVDVEDYYQVFAFAKRIKRQDWPGYVGRVERNTNAILEMFADFGVQGTFFTLGWIAERYPQLVRRIAAEGHEIASHGFAHVKVWDQDRDEFREDIGRTKGILEDLSGTAVRGYRAASFSISKDTLWAFDILAEEGYRYSSSIYPIRHDHYGMPDAPRFQFRPRDGRDFREIPVSTATLMGQRVPCGGGGYFRLLPYGLSKWAMKRVNDRDRQPCMFYFHPWEIDPEQPRIDGVSFKARFRHYTNLGQMEQRLRVMLADFAWGRVDRVFPMDP